MLKNLLMNKIKKAREEAGFTQQGLADALEVSQVTVARWENGERSPSLTVIKSISMVTKHDMAWFFTEKEYLCTENDSEEIKALIDKVKQLNDEGFRRLIDYIELLLMKYHK